MNVLGALLICAALAAAELPDGWTLDPGEDWQLMEESWQLPDGSRLAARETAIDLTATLAEMRRLLPDLAIREQGEGEHQQRSCTWAAATCTWQAQPLDLLLLRLAGERPLLVIVSGPASLDRAAVLLRFRPGYGP